MIESPTLVGVQWVGTVGMPHYLHTMPNLYAQLCVTGILMMSERAPQKKSTPPPPPPPIPACGRGTFR